MIFKKYNKEKIKINSIIKPGSNKDPKLYSELWIKIHAKAKASIHDTLSTIKVKTPKWQCISKSIIRLISEARLLLLLPTVRPCLKTMESGQSSQSTGNPGLASLIAQGPEDTIKLRRK